MEAWRQRPLGGREEKRAEQNETSIHLTPTGLLMEGVYTHNPIVGALAMLRQSTLGADERLPWSLQRCNKPGFSPRSMPSPPKNKIKKIVTRVDPALPPSTCQ